MSQDDIQEVDQEYEHEQEQKQDEEPKFGTQDNGESGTLCMICMEEWTIGSSHRICCLGCGHLFGRSCIERWIKEKGSSAKCPTCNKAAKKVHIRNLWCKTIKATDNSELCELQQLLESERKLRKTDSASIFHLNLKIEMWGGEIEKLKKGIIERDQKIRKMQQIIDKYHLMRSERLNGANTSIGDETMQDINSESIDNFDEDIIEVEPQELKGKFHFAEKIVSDPSGRCRSIALCPTAAVVLVAQPSPQNTRQIWSGYGLRKYSILDSSIREFIPLHSEMITSIQLRPIGDLILTSSQDKRVRITSIINNTCIQSYQCNFEPVCVAWSAHRDQQFYVAYGNCFISLYDMRNTSEYIYQTSRKIANTRPLSIVSTADPEGLCGVLVNDARGSQFLEVSQTSGYDLENIDRSIDHLKSHTLPFDGLMGTVDYDKQSNMALISTRRTSALPRCTHNLIKLKRLGNEEDGTATVRCENIRTFTGGRSGELLSRSKLLQHPTMRGSVLVGACDGEAQGVKLWDSSDNTEYQSIRTDSFIRDMVMYSPENSNQHLLYLLGERSMSIYKWDYA